VILASAALLAGAGAGCGERRPAAQAPAPPAAAVHPRAGGDRGGGGKTLRIAVVPKGTTHDFWKAVHAGAVKAATELGNVEVTWQGPEKEDDREQQVALVQNLISAGYDAICLAPLDDRALVAPVRQATAAGITVVIIDSGLRADVGTDYASYVATDNKKGGELAGAKLAQLMGGPGKALLLRYQEGSASTALREQGFLDAISRAAGVQVVDPHRYAGPTRATAQEAAENLLAADADVRGVFCPNESSTFGMLLALRGRGMAGKVRFIGFDSSPAMVEALRKGELDALVLQNPMRMGELGVKTAAAAVRGEPVEPRIDTGVGLVTRADMDTPESKELLSPPIAGILGGP
jgi:ribose transport system substrate-binding protein